MKANMETYKWLANIKSRFPITVLIIEYILILFFCFMLADILEDHLWKKNLILLHTSFELICVFTAMVIFVIVWYVYNSTSCRNQIIGFGFLVVAIFDTLHTLYFVPLNYAPQTYFDLSARYWMLGRFAEAIALLYSLAIKFKGGLNKYIVLLFTLGGSFCISSLIYFSASYSDVLITCFMLINKLF